ncbi:MAG: hypothetical protein ACJ768_00790 [Gaiellaceae bacterium]
MSALWPVLGYDDVARDVARALESEHAIALIEGPPGVGKSGLAGGIGELWELGGGSAVVAEGDSLRADVAFYPLSYALVGLQRRWKPLGAAVAGMTRAGETLVGTAGIITATVEMLASAHRGRRRRRAPLLGDVERDILFELEQLGKTRPLLLIADNAHWWDARSLEFLGRLREPRMRDAFPFLASLRVLGVQTPEPYQTVANPAAHDALLGSSQTRRFTLGRVPREGFDEVLVALGAAATPSREVADVLHQLTGGHLALARRCVARLDGSETETIQAASDPDDFVGGLLTDRLRLLGTVGEEVVALLQVAAVWGLTFRREEVACATGADEGETARLLRYCRDEEVVELSNGRATFVHDLFRQYFLGLAARDQAGIYERMSDCLRRLHPAEYDLRCLSALNAERSREAAALGVQAALQRQREGGSWIDLARTIVDAIEHAGMTPLVSAATEAQEHLREYRFRECLNTLDTFPRDIPKRLLAEADYLRAMTLLSTRSERDRATARAILSAWIGYERDEPELGTRLLQLLLYGRFHVRDKEQGLALEAHLKQFLADRVEFDPAAEDALYTLDRCSGGLYQADVSLVRIREAAAHFGPKSGQTLLRRPVEYYRCLVNLGAALISNGSHDEAREIHRQLEQLVADYATDAFPRVDLPRMNNVIAEFRAGAVDAESAAARQREIASSPAVANDPFYAGNALAVYLTLAEHYDEALALFDRLDGQLGASRVEPEPSMIYLIRGNRCAARLAAGDVEGRSAEWEALAGLVDAIAYPSQPIWVRRHEFLGPVIAEGAPASALAFDEALLVRHATEIGPLWRHYGRGFMLPSVEIWREN